MKKITKSDRIHILTIQLGNAETHLRIAERELIAKERLIIELKDWITTLIQGEK